MCFCSLLQTSCPNITQHFGPTRKTATNTVAEQMYKWASTHLFIFSNRFLKWQRGTWFLSRWRQMSGTADKIVNIQECVFWQRPLHMALINALSTTLSMKDLFLCYSSKVYMWLFLAIAIFRVVYQNYEITHGCMDKLRPQKYLKSEQKFLNSCCIKCCIHC